MGSGTVLAWQAAKGCSPGAVTAGGQLRPVAGLADSILQRGEGIARQPLGRQLHAPFLFLCVCVCVK